MGHFCRRGAVYALGGLYTEDAAVTLYPTWGPQQFIQPGSMMESSWRMNDYMSQLRTSFTKLCRLRFLQPDGSTAFAIDNNPKTNEVERLSKAEPSHVICRMDNAERQTLRSPTLTLNMITTSITSGSGSKSPLTKDLCFPADMSITSSRGVLYCGAAGNAQPKYPDGFSSAG